MAGTFFGNLDVTATSTSYLTCSEPIESQRPCVERRENAKEIVELVTKQKKQTSPPTCIEVSKRAGR